MKNFIKNMIDVESITRVRNSVNTEILPFEKNSLVNLTPLEYFNNSAKVLINGKLFIAQIDQTIPTNEEIIAWVVETNPFVLSLNLFPIYRKNRNIFLDQIIQKLKLRNSKENKSLIARIIEEEVPVIKSKVISLDELTQKFRVKDLELSLLISLIWKFSEREVYSISDLYENLFSLSFTTVCKNIFKNVKELLLSNEDNYLLNEVNSNLIYDEKRENIKALQSKSDDLFRIIKYLNARTSNNVIINEFIKFSSIYILQKSVFKDYDYYPDFAIVKKKNGLAFIKYNIKKMYLSNGAPSYTVDYEHEEIPIKVKGFFRNNFLSGNIDSAATKNDVLQNEIKQMKNTLKNKWEINSDIKISEEHISITENTIHQKGINKLVS
jgi:hypothetical protein